MSTAVSPLPILRETTHDGHLLLTFNATPNESTDPSVTRLPALHVRNWRQFIVDHAPSGSDKVAEVSFTPRGYLTHHDDRMTLQIVCRIRGNAGQQATAEKNVTAAIEAARQSWNFKDTHTEPKSARQFSDGADGLADFTRRVAAQYAEEVGGEWHDNIGEGDLPNPRFANELRPKSLPAGEFVLENVSTVYGHTDPSDKLKGTWWWYLGLSPGGTEMGASLVGIKVDESVLATDPVFADLGAHSVFVSRLHKMKSGATWLQAQETLPVVSSPERYSEILAERFNQMRSDESRTMPLGLPVRELPLAWEYLTDTWSQWAANNMLSTQATGGDGGPSENGWKLRKMQLSSLDLTNLARGPTLGCLNRGDLPYHVAPLTWENPNLQT